MGAERSLSHLEGSWPAELSFLKVIPSSQTTWGSGVFSLSRKLRKGLVLALYTTLH